MQPQRMQQQQRQPQQKLPATQHLHPQELRQLKMLRKQRMPLMCRVVMRRCLKKRLPKDVPPRRIAVPLLGLRRQLLQEQHVSLVLMRATKVVTASILRACTDPTGGASLTRSKLHGEAATSIVHFMGNTQSWPARSTL